MKKVVPHKKWDGKMWSISPMRFIDIDQMGQSIHVKMQKMGSFGKNRIFDHFYEIFRNTV
jgi:hypothetical protein